MHALHCPGFWVNMRLSQGENNAGKLIRELHRSQVGDCCVVLTNSIDCHLRGKKKRQKACRNGEEIVGY